MEKLDFETRVRKAINKANLGVVGTDPAPWIVLMEYVIELEKRVYALEQKNGKTTPRL